MEMTGMPSVLKFDTDLQTALGKLGGA